MDEWNLQGDTIGHGSYVEGKQDGLWSFQNSSGQSVLELTFQQGVIDGPAVIHQPHRISYHIEKNKEIPGRRQLALDGRSYSADDPTTGKTVAAFDPPEFAKLHWVPRNGPFDPEPQVTDEESWADGRPKRLVCKLVVAENEIAHVPHGSAQSWYANGQLHRQQSYRDGLPDGVFEEWYDDGKSRYRVEFLLGQPVGDWAFWYQNGQKQAEGKSRRAL